MKLETFLFGYIVGFVLATVGGAVIAIAFSRIDRRKYDAHVAQLEDDIDHRKAEIVILKQQLNQRRMQP